MIIELWVSKVIDLYINQCKSKLIKTQLLHPGIQISILSETISMSDKVYLGLITIRKLTILTYLHIYAH